MRVGPSQYVDLDRVERDANDLRGGMMSFDDGGPPARRSDRALAA